MESEAIHELTAAYALDALDVHETEEFEEHLRHCPQCREELVGLREAATALAYAAPAPPAADALRGRILDRARAERSNVIPLPRRVSAPLAAAAAFAACAAIGLGIWAAILHGDLSSQRSARAREAQVIDVLGNATRRASLTGAPGSVAVDPAGRAVLVVNRLGAAPPGRTYEAWVITGKKPVPAGLFGGGGRVLVPLSSRVPAGSIVAVTVERKGGVPQPTGKPILSARVT